MDNILEKYERYSFAERQLIANEPESPVNWTIEHSKVKARIELLQRNQRHYMGEDLDAMSVKDLQNMEQQLDSALKNIRSRKNQLLFDSISELQKKEKAIQEQNSMLAKKIKDKEKELVHQTQWEQQNPTTNTQPQYLMASQLPCVNMGGNTYNEESEARRNELDLALDSLHSCHLGCFAA
ncbi:hypothetical protein SASPL_133155 [Salvia splendens]|uniref:K-box domain-containing protein n=2 Tax=Salvia splendens TaxID=180675 RepID=A0A8X8X3S1_SALSN|nr:hypothetical protein SASPL_133155 [Salvia splendens]